MGFFRFFYANSGHSRATRGLPLLTSDRKLRNQLSRVAGFLVEFFASKGENMSNELARTELRNTMMSLSEKAMSAQWYSDLEFILWDRLNGGPSRLGNITLTGEMLEELSRLSTAAGGWFEFSDLAEQTDGDGLVFVANREWVPRYEAWLKRVPPEARPRDR